MKSMFSCSSKSRSCRSCTSLSKSFLEKELPTLILIHKTKVMDKCLWIGGMQSNFIIAQAAPCIIHNNRALLVLQEFTKLPTKLSLSNLFHFFFFFFFTGRHDTNNIPCWRWTHRWDLQHHGLPLWSAPPTAWFFRRTCILNPHPSGRGRIHFSSFCSSFTWPSTSPNREASYTTNLLNFSRKNVTLLSAISFFTTLLSLGANKRQRKPLCSKEKEDDLFGLHSPGFSSLRMKEREAFFLSQFFPLMTNNGDPFLLRRGTSSCPFLYSNTKLHSQLHTNSILNTVFNRIRYRSNHTKSSAKKFVYSLTFFQVG